MNNANSGGSFVNEVMGWAAEAEEFTPEIAFLTYSQGVIYGSPDFILPVSVGDFCGLMVFVSEGDTPSVDQVAWANCAGRLRLGTVTKYCMVRVWGHPAAAINAIREYLDVPAKKKAH